MKPKIIIATGIIVLIAIAALIYNLVTNSNASTPETVIEIQNKYNEEFDNQLLVSDSEPINFDYIAPKALPFNQSVNNKFTIKGKSGNVLISDFRDNSDVELFDSASGSYYLATNQPDFKIIFSGFDQAFQLNLLARPVSESSLKAKQYLVTALGLESENQVCELQLSVNISAEASSTGFTEPAQLPGC